MSKATHAVFDCEDAPKWDGHQQLYIGRFGQADTKWDVFKCWNSELPELAAAHRYKAIFITGSHYSAYEDLPWINNLVAWLHEFVIKQKAATKIVAVCFGCQVIACGLGGKIGKNTSGGFVLTVEDLSLQPGLKEKAYFQEALRERGQASEECKQLKVIESHSDQVLELPEGAELLASSQTAPNEIWTYQDRVLAIQGHPEMPSQEALQKIWPFLSSNGRLSEDEAAASKYALENMEPDSATIQAIMQAFVSCSGEAGAPQGEEPAASSYTSWLPSMSLPSMPRPGMSLPSVPMPSMGLPSVSLPSLSLFQWVPYASSSPAAPEDANTCSATDASSAAESAGQEMRLLQHSSSSRDACSGSAPAAETMHAPHASAVTLSGPDQEDPQRPPGSSVAEGESSNGACTNDLPISTHAAGTGLGAAGSETSQAASPERSAGRELAPAMAIGEPCTPQAGNTQAKAEEFLEHLCRAVAAELDGSRADMQLLFGVNTLARGEFLRILQELTHWLPLAKDMKRKQEECVPMLAALDALEARMDSIESAIKILDQQTTKLIDST